MEHSNTEVKGMPEGAFEVLPEGKEYKPYVPADKIIPETTFRAVIWGLIMSAIFSAAAAFLGLKIGQVFEAAIPIAIIAVGVSPLFKRKSTILENVIIQSIGATSGVIVAGAIFTLPALFILGLDKSIGIDLLKIFFVSFLGGVLGILFLIPFRKYFVQEMHGQFPFPEATATAQILVAGEKGGEQAKVLVISMLIGGVYDFMVHSVAAFNEVFTSRVLPFGKFIADRVKLVFKLDVLTAVLGLGYIIGLKYTAIIAFGSMLSWFVLIPFVYHFGNILPANVLMTIGDRTVAQMTAEEIFRSNIRFVGIGAIAMAGIVGIIKSSKIIGQAFGMGFKQIFKKETAGETKTAVKRTEQDLNMKNIIILIGLTCLVLFLFFKFSILTDVEGSLKISIVALVVVFIISFLFTTVAARAIAIVGTNPVSGMTMMTLILSSIVLMTVGLSGNYGMMAALLIGGVVCTALSQSGAFITDLKIGYWLGSTPLKQQRFKFAGTFVAAASVGLVIFLLNGTYGFSPAQTDKTTPIVNELKAMEITETTIPAVREKLTLLNEEFEKISVPQQLKIQAQEIAASNNPEEIKTELPKFIDQFQNAQPLAAPQANAMAALIQPLMKPGAVVPWFLYLAGAIIALILERLKIAPLAFALGMYIPLELNTPLLVGGYISYLVLKSTQDKELAARRNDRGILIGSGFIAGGAIIGVISALLKYLDVEKYIQLGWANKPYIGEWISLIMFVGVCLYVFYDAKRAK
ncbi:MAG: oligopeptide transporter, OPT family [Acidobacteria bacterium]|jgi:putative OPT family oligopeptide transporter|nr:oligopeptide transporter, OPT family [Acidobacteriota bacterium]